MNRAILPDIPCRLGVPVASSRRGVASQLLMTMPRVPGVILRACDESIVAQTHMGGSYE